MYGYTIVHWLMFFYIYCILGWCWETPFVSIKGRKFTNRGFMVGPWLPIYGSGAIIMLVAALPFKENVVLVFFFGMAAATILEYCSGAAIEAIFKVRYWDYTKQPLNLNGHICFFCSLGWGAASVALIEFLHKPIEGLVMSIDYAVLRWVVAVLSVIIAIDFTLSCRAALDLQGILKKLTESNNEISRLKKRLDVLIAVIDDDRLQLVKRYDDKISHTKERYYEIYDNMRQKFTIIDQMRHGVGKIISFPTEELSNEYEKIKMRFGFIDEMTKERKSHINIWVKRIVKDNPTVKSRKYDTAIEELKDMLRSKRKKNDSEDSEE